MFNKDSFNNFDFLLFGAVLLTVAIGCLMIYSAGFDPIEKINNGMYKKQILWFVFGVVIMVAISLVNYNRLGDYSIYIYSGTLVILLFTAIFSSPIRNSRAWLNLGLFSVQPSEFMKLALVIMLGKYLEFRERDMKHFRELLIPSVLTFIPVIIILKQPDFGTAVTLIPILFIMLFVAGADVIHLFSIISIVAIAVVVPMFLTYQEWIGDKSSNFILDFFKNINMIFIVAGGLLLIAISAYLLNLYFIKKIFRRIYIPATVFSFGLAASVIIQKWFKLYQKKRILVFLNPDLDPHASGYNIIQSKIAIGSGGFFGKGFLKGSQAQLGFLPEKTSDFVFSVIAEEWGLLGSLILLALLFFIVYRSIQISFEAKDKFGALLASGISSIFFFHVVINIGMVIGIMPVTGLPLSFVSYGGSNLIMSMIAVGILINIRSKKFVY